MEESLYRIDEISRVGVSMFVGDKDGICDAKVAEDFSYQF